MFLEKSKFLLIVVGRLMVTDLSILYILGPTEPPSHTERAGEKSSAWEGAAIVSAKSAEADKERNVAR